MDWWDRVETPAVPRPPELQIEGAMILSRFGPNLCYYTEGKVMKVVGPFEDGRWTLVLEPTYGKSGWINGVGVVNGRLAVNGNDPIEVLGFGAAQMKMV